MTKHKMIEVLRCKSKKVNGKYTEASCTVNGKRLSKSESIKIIEEKD